MEGLLQELVWGGARMRSVRQTGAVETQNWQRMGGSLAPTLFSCLSCEPLFCPGQEVGALRPSQQPLSEKQGNRD